jgi:hypothetical protein
MLKIEFEKEEKELEKYLWLGDKVVKINSLIAGNKVLLNII